MASDEWVPVRDESRHGRIWLLSIKDGNAVPAPDSQVRFHGIGLPCPKPFSAAFAFDGRIWLQVGRRRWDAARIRRVQQEEEGAAIARYRLEFRDGSTEQVTIRFPAKVAWFRAMDPTHDEIDSLSEDVMKILPYRAVDGWTAGPSDDVAEWIARVLPLWSAGLQLSARPS